MIVQRTTLSRAIFMAIQRQEVEERNLGYTRDSTFLDTLRKLLTVLVENPDDQLVVRADMIELTD